MTHNDARKRFLPACATLLACLPVTGHTAGHGETIDLTSSWVGFAALLTFAVAYLAVVAEEFTQLRKSKPVIVAAGIIWGMIAWHYHEAGIPHTVEAAARHDLLEYAELMLFLLVAMTYVNSMDERGVFDSLRAWMVRRGFGATAIFWITGGLSFVISPFADNLTTALLMCAVLMAAGVGQSRFIGLGCINVVIAANAGGAFSPFGDITTLMVWQKEKVDFFMFFTLFLPSLVNWLVPAVAMSLALGTVELDRDGTPIPIKRGGLVIIALFALTMATAVFFHRTLDLPPVLGMFTGFGYLQLFGYYLKRKEHAAFLRSSETSDLRSSDAAPFDIMQRVAQSEWDTLLFFYGVVMCVGGLGFIGYLAELSGAMYSGWGATIANVFVGVLSAVVDNIPVMFAVLTMDPDMSIGQWLLVTLTAGVGGSLLSIGSAAGVALMGQAHGHYTFFRHLRWTPVIALGYGASIYVHMLVNARLFR